MRDFNREKYGTDRESVCINSITRKGDGSSGSLSEWDFRRIIRAFCVWFRLIFGSGAANDGLAERSSESDDSDDSILA
eukprot:SAG31_NODE_2508_length_5589_cov_11.540073_3_plen_78_part_00